MTDEQPRTGARQRRRGLYGPPPRLTRTSPLTGRLVWHIGDWGRASEHIGARWEHVAGALARDRLGPQDYLIVLAATPVLMAEVLSSGLPHAGALETALSAARNALGLEPTTAPEPRDGRFVAPVHPANHAALLAEPELPTLLLPVDPHAFFEPLPGWSAARALARLESADLGRLNSIEAIERYYRLGAGVEGALTRLSTGLFDTEPARIDAVALIGELRQTGRARTLNVLLLHLQHELATRKTLEERLTLLPRSAYAFGRLRGELQKLGLPRTVLDSRGALGRAYAEVTRAMASEIRAEGQQLVADGVSTEAALEQLAAQGPRRATIGAAHTRAVAARLMAT